jgi:cytochrome P450
MEDVMIKDLKIMKGDIATANTYCIKCCKHIFEDPEDFKIDRFTKLIDIDIERFAYNPFRQGKRACIGKNLGQIMIMIIVSQFCRMYEFKKPADVEYYKKSMIVIIQSNPWVKVRSKKHVTR